MILTNFENIYLRFEEMTNSSVQPDPLYGPPENGGMIALIIFGTTFGIFLLITVGETIIRICREWEITRLPYHYTVSSDPEEDNRNSANAAKEETFA